MARLKMTEGQLQAAVMDLAKLHGLLVHHCRPAQIREGKWVTPIQGAKGFPDLVIAGLGGVAFRELKNDVLAPTPEQMRWLGVLDAGGSDAGLWRPEQLHSGEIAQVLAQLAKPKAGDGDE